MDNEYTFIKWSFESHPVPMVDTPEYGLITTTKPLALALDMTPRALKWIWNTRPAEFGNLTLSGRIPTLKDFLHQHRDIFGIKRMQPTIRLWTEDDVLLFAMRADTARGVMMRKDFVQFLKRHARRDMVSINAMKQIVQDFEIENATLRKRVEALEENARLSEKIISFLKPYLEDEASHAGKALSFHRQTKDIRKVH